MKKTVALLTAGVMAASLLFAGCGSGTSGKSGSGACSNEYIEISQYEKLKVAKVEKQEVTDEDVDNEIEAVRSSNLVDVTDRAVKDGDTATIDYEGKKDGVAFDGGSSASSYPEGYPLVIGSGTFIEGFEDGVIGHKIGETFDLPLTFPENYGNTDLAGQKVVFTITVRGIQAEAELNDELVKKVSEKSKTVAEYREEIKAELEENNALSAEQTLLSEVWDALINNVTVNKYPEDRVNALLDEMTQYYQDYAKAYGMEFADFLSQYMQMDEDSFKETATEVAKEQVKQYLATDLLVEKLKIDTSDNGLKDEYQVYMDYYGYSTIDELKSYFEEQEQLEQLEYAVKMRAIQKKLVETCEQVDESELESTDEETSTEKSE